MGNEATHVTPFFMRAMRPMGAHGIPRARSHGDHYPFASMTHMVDNTHVFSGEDAQERYFMHYEAYTMIGHHTMLAIESHPVTAPDGERLGSTLCVTRSVAAYDFQSPQLIAACPHTERTVEHTTQNMAAAFETYARLSMAEMTNELFERAADEGRTNG